MNTVLIIPVYQFLQIIFQIQILHAHLIESFGSRDTKKLQTNQPSYQPTNYPTDKPVGKTCRASSDTESCRGFRDMGWRWKTCFQNTTKIKIKTLRRQRQQQQQIYPFCKCKLIKSV